jgi:hypothetical protein
MEMAGHRDEILGNFNFLFALWDCEDECGEKAQKTNGQRRPGGAISSKKSKLTSSVKGTFSSKKEKTTAPRDSHVLSNRSTKEALSGLTSEIGRDPVFSGRYGRSCKSVKNIGL